LLKRTFDIAVSLILFVALLPLMLLISVWIALDTSGPLLFRQWRVGRFGKPFLIYKFRSMVVGADRAGPLVTSGADARITRSGRFLRKYKLDEFPQLINVLKGDMSFVGPRPEVAKYVEHWSDRQRRLILSVRPGITDPGSIEFRHEEAILRSAADPERFYIETILPDKLALYCNYVETRSFVGDLALMARTVATVLLKR
jgi:lipopolysaccharide/colanic/teichoic acid biosynthesis glycosyltransferase